MNSNAENFDYKAWENITNSKTCTNSKFYLIYGTWFDKCLGRACSAFQIFEKIFLFLFFQIRRSFKSVIIIAVSIIYVVHAAGLLNGCVYFWCRHLYLNLYLCLFIRQVQPKLGQSRRTAADVIGHAALQMTQWTISICLLLNVSFLPHSRS